LERPSEGSKLYETWASHREPREAARRATEREYRLVSGVAYAVFLPVAAAARLMPRASAHTFAVAGLRDARSWATPGPCAESSISIAFTA
jgi:hypothetical protein